MALTPPPPEIHVAGRQGGKTTRGPKPDGMTYAEYDAKLEQMKKNPLAAFEGGDLI